MELRKDHQNLEYHPFFADEVRALYRSFKQECPNGIVDEETFKEVYERIFPLGDASRYAHLVFAAIDRYFELDIKLNVWYNPFCFQGKYWWNNVR